MVSLRDWLLCWRCADELCRCLINCLLWGCCLDWCLLWRMMIMWGKRCLLWRSFINHTENYDWKWKLNPGGQGLRWEWSRRAHYFEMHAYPTRKIWRPTMKMMISFNATLRSLESIPSIHCSFALALFNPIVLPWMPFSFLKWNTTISSHALLLSVPVDTYECWCSFQFDSSVHFLSFVLADGGDGLTMDWWFWLGGASSTLKCWRCYSSCLFFNVLVFRAASFEDLFLVGIMVQILFLMWSYFLRCYSLVRAHTR